MSTDFFGFELDDDPICPNCRRQEVGINQGGYYCLNCFYPLIKYSKGVPNFSLPEVLARTQKSRIIDCSECEVIQDWAPRPSNVVDFLSFKNKVRAKKHEPIAEDHLPSDYEECPHCKFDHAYDQTPAKRWHDEHPQECVMLTSEDLIEEI
jgi:hypothetical protein